MVSSATSLLASFLLLTGSSIVSIHRSRRDAAAVAFVGATYASIVLLFCSLRWFEAAPPRSGARDGAKVCVWLTTTLLTAMFSCKVAALLPGLVAAAVFLMAASTVIGGFYVLFLLPMADDGRLLMAN